jgi:predicted metal-dependent hydrolase
VGMETRPETTALRYRREAEHLRHAVEMIDEVKLREQLLSIARQYDAAAGSIEQELRLKPASAKA